MSIRWGLEVLLLMYLAGYTLVFPVWQAANLVASRAVVREDVVLEVDLEVESISRFCSSGQRPGSGFHPDTLRCTGFKCYSSRYYLSLLI